MNELLVGLIIGFGSLILLVQVALLVKFSAVVKAQTLLSASMQVLSEQMSDLEEKSAEAQNDIRKLMQYFVNFARGTKGGGTDKSWWSNG
jgi:hypothetical protein